MSERYGFSLTTFSPSGKLVQIEYALNAVAAGAPSVGIKGKLFSPKMKYSSIKYSKFFIKSYERCCVSYREKAKNYSS